MTTTRTLTDDLALLSQLHHTALRESGQPELVDEVKRVVEACQPDAESASNTDAAALVASLDPEHAAALTRTVTVHLHLTNLAEERLRARSLRAEDADYTGSVEAGDVWPAIQAVEADVQARLNGLRIQPVLTAHPTEARRRAVSNALRRIARQLDRFDSPLCGPREQQVAKRRMLEDINILQRTSTLRQTRPEPQDEVKTMLTVFDQTMFRAVPRLYRAVEAAVWDTVGRSEPRPSIDAFVRFGSWVGGDRDGNPHVTAEVTRETLGTQADQALSQLYFHVDRVARTLTMDADSTVPSPELTEALANDAVAAPEVFADIAKSSPNEPHRQKMLLIGERVAGTRAEHAGTAYRGPEEMLEDLRLVQRSLADAGDLRSAEGELQHLIWMVQTFGFHLAELEVRQHSAVHREALVELFTELTTRGIKIAGQPIGDPEDAATNVELLDHLACHGWPASVSASTTRSKEVLNTLRVMAWLQGRWGVACCGRYIVSFSQSAADLVAVRALASLAVGKRPLRLDVVPLFETGEDLRAAVTTLDAWFGTASTTAWLAGVERRVEVMLGYSDSAKDVGPASAALTLYDAQTALVDWAKRQSVELTMFHGRGGSLGRGGGPLHRAITAQPTGSVDGRFKVTEQGEVIFARYADVTIAQHHLERVTSAVLLADQPGWSASRDEAAKRFADLSDVVEGASRKAYRSLMDAPGVADLLTSASPLDELGDLRLGSRPARRNAGKAERSLDDLRAIPWVFSWSMTRVNLPGWYGLGSGLQAVGDVAALREAYQEWPLFKAMIDIAEMSLSKVNAPLARAFLSLGNRPDLSDQIMAELDLTTSWVLDVLDQTHLLERKPHLRTAIALRGPYIDALSQIQHRALSVLRSAGAEASDSDADLAAWRHVLLLTVNGAAAGLQNTG